MKTTRSLLAGALLGGTAVLLVQQVTSAPAAAVIPQQLAVALTTAALAAGSSCPGDLNGDNAVNSADLSILLGNFGTTCVPDNDGDGFPADQDCDDTNPAIFPGTTQACASGQPGVCNAGTRTCQANGIWTACIPNITPGSLPESCNGLDDNCNGSTDEGGGGCPPRPNAFNFCVSGTCTLQCTPGFSNCDADDTNGCEVAHAIALNSCASAEFLGTACGDLQCTGFCTSSSALPAFSRNGNRARWFRVRMSECSGSCPGNLAHTVRLTSPSGINYDLYVYSACGTLVGSATNPSGTLDAVTYTRTRTAADDSADYFIEVRFQAGSSCSNWGLSVEARNCS